MKPGFRRRHEPNLVAALCLIGGGGMGLLACTCAGLGSMKSPGGGVMLGMMAVFGLVFGGGPVVLGAVLLCEKAYDARLEIREDGLALFRDEVEDGWIPFKNVNKVRLVMGPETPRSSVIVPVAIVIETTGDDEEAWWFRDGKGNPRPVAAEGATIERGWNKMLVNMRDDIREAHLRYLDARGLLGDGDLSEIGDAPPPPPRKRAGDPPPANEGKNPFDFG